MITEANWKLPDGHESVAAFASLHEAEAEARSLLRAGGNGERRFYITNKRGAFEVIRYA